MEALSGVEKKTLMVASLAEALIKVFGSPLCHGLVRIFGSPPLPTPGKDFLLIHKIVDVFLFVFGPGLRRTSQYTCIKCVGDGVLGLRQIKTCRKVPLQVNFF